MATLPFPDDYAILFPLSFRILVNLPNAKQHINTTNRWWSDSIVVPSGVRTAKLLDVHHFMLCSNVHFGFMSGARCLTNTWISIVKIRRTHDLLILWWKSSYVEKRFYIKTGSRSLRSMIKAVGNKTHQRKTLSVYYLLRDVPRWVFYPCLFYNAQNAIHCLHKAACMEDINP